MASEVLLMIKTVPIQRQLARLNNLRLGVVQQSVTHQVVIIIIESALLFSTAVVVIMVLALLNMSPAVKGVLVDSVSIVLSADSSKYLL